MMTSSSESEPQQKMFDRKNYLTLHVYDKDEVRKVLKGVKLAECMLRGGRGGGEAKMAYAESSPSRSERPQNAIRTRIEERIGELGSPETLQCSYCSVTFPDRTSQRQHYKLDWHRYNLKQRLRGISPVSEDKFCVMADDVSSISGSDSDEEWESDSTNPGSPRHVVNIPKHQENRPYIAPSQFSIISTTDTEDEQDTQSAVRHGKVFFENDEGNIFAMHRCLLVGKKAPPASEIQFVSCALQIPSHTSWAIIMLGGGHFAGAIFEGKEMLVHKTFHSYTVRSKQGSSQSARDGKGGASHPKSAGASMRRYNEASLAQHIQEIVESWSELLSRCQLIFYRAVSHNRSTLFGGKNPPLRKLDTRIRSIPFPTRRATLNEVKRVYELLATVEVYGKAEYFNNLFPKSPRRPMGSKKTKQEQALEENDQLCLADTEGGESETSEASLRLPVLDLDKVSSTKRRMDRGKARPSPSRPLPDIVNELAKSSLSDESDTSETEDEFKVQMFEKVDSSTIDGMDPSPLIEVNSEINFVESLKEHEDTVPRSIKNKSKMQKKNNKPKIKGKGTEKCDGYEHMRHCLKTACKLGDLHLLLSTLRGRQWPTSDTCTNSVSSSTEEHQSSTLPPPEKLKEILNETTHHGSSTLLHLASQAGYKDIAKVLLERGSDPTIEDSKKRVPYCVAVDKETRNIFRRYRRDFPDAYDYSKAQIPEIMTEQEEMARAERIAEKKRNQRKVKKEKDKLRKQMEEEKRLEQDERKRFLNLSDREKRALAAERRIVTEATRGGGAQPVLSRCFQCGFDITGKVPFEYSDNRFCSVVCLQTHRKIQKPS